MATTRMVFNLVANDSASSAFDKLARNVELSNAAIARHNATAKASTRALDDNAKSIDKNAKSADKNNSSLSRLSGTLKITSAGFSKLGAALLFAPAAAAGIGLLGGAAIGLGGAFAATGLAAGAFGAVAIPVLKDAGTAAKAVQVAQNNYNAAIASGTPKATAYKAEMLAINKAYANMSPQQIALSKQLGGISDAWGKVKAAQTPVISGALQSWLRAVTPLLAGLAPIIAKVAPVVHDLGVKFDTIVNSVSFKAFISFIAGTGSAGLRAAGGGILDLINAFILTLPTFTPLFESANAAIARIGPAVMKWASSQKTADGIQSFMAWFYANGPVLTQLLKNVGGALVTLAPGLTAGGITELRLVSDFFGLVAKLPPNLAAPIAETAGALLLLNKLGVLSVGVKLTKAVAVGALGKTMLGRMLLGDAGAAAGALVLPVTLSIAAIAGLDQIHDKTGGGTLVAPKAADLGYNGRWARDISHWYDLVRHDVSAIWDLMWNNTVGRLQRGVADSDKILGGWEHNVAAAFSGAAHWLVSAGSNIINGLLTGIGSFWNRSVAPWFAALPGRFVSAVGSLNTALGGTGRGMMMGFLGAVTGFWNRSVVPWFTALPGRVMGFLSASRTWLVSSGSGIITGLWNGITSFWNRSVVPFFLSIPGRIKGFFVSAWSWLTSPGSQTSGGLLNGITSFWNRSVVPFFLSVPGRILAFFRAAPGWLVNAGWVIISGLYNGLTGHWPAVGAFLASIWGRVTGAFRGAGIWLFNSGFSIVNGLYQGILSLARGIGSWVNAHLVQPIIIAVKHYFGINSPSTVMAGIGGHLMSGLLGGMLAHNPLKIIDKVFGGMPQALESLLGKGIVSLASLPSKALSALGRLGGAIGGFFSKLIGGGGSGVERWRGTVLQALAMNGLPASLAGRVLYQMQTESGGSVNAINLTDVNAQRGDPSRGLMQVIGSTFAAYHVAGTSNNIYDPLANIAAAINYARHVYGPGLGALGSGHGYALGSWDVPVTGPATVHQGEMILPAELASAVRGAIGGGGGPQTEQLLKQLIVICKQIVQAVASQGDQFGRALDGAARRARAY